MTTPPRPAAARRRYGVLLLVTSLSLCVQGIAPAGPVQQVVVAALAGASVLLAFRAADMRPRLFAFAAALTALVLLVAIFRAVGGEGVGEGAARAMNAALVALGPPAIVVGVTRELRASGHVRLDAVMGVLSLYMLIGMLFAFVYGAIDRFGGDPFFANGDPATVSHCLYFSFATLATVGYGDLVARSDLGHTLAVAEMLIGQIYLVTIVSVIVGNLGRPAGRDSALLDP